MATSAKIVQFDPNSKRRDQARLSRLAQPVNRVREKSQLILTAFFRVFFESVDDILFELADNADSVADQDAFFDAMRSLRMQRGDILNRLRQGIDHNFASLIDDESEHGPEDAESAANGLASIHEEELDEVVAQEAFINRANLANQVELERLCKRFCSAANTTVNLKSLPIGPDAICSLFGLQVKRCDVIVKVKLVLYEQLENKILDVLKPLYTSLNQVMAESGVLPELELNAIRGELGKVKSAQLKPVKKKPDLWAKDQLKPLDSRVASVIESLIDDSSVAEFIVTETLLSLLTNAQHTVADDASLLGQKTLSVISNALKAQGATGKIARQDAEAIKLVGLFFECIYKEYRLAVKFRLLLNRLQIPLVKVALQDKKFFTDPKHAARIFVSALARLGQTQGTDDRVLDETNPVFKLSTAIVDQVVGEFDLEASLFERLVRKLPKLESSKPYDKALSERWNRIERETDEQKQVARGAIDQLVDKYIGEKEMPGVIAMFVDRVWRKVLLQSYVKYGKNSEQWNLWASTLRELVWSVQPVESDHHRRKLLAAIPDLNKRLHQALQGISYNPHEVAAMINSINQIHVSRVRMDADFDKKNAAESVCETVFDRTSGQAADDSDSSSNSEPSTLPETDAHMRYVAQLARGARFEYRVEGRQPQRCVLAAVIKQSATYIFVNRGGAKVVQMSATKFALALKRGELEPLDSGMAYDDALQKVVTGLRRPQDDPS